jgi:hypothetical protein
VSGSDFPSSLSSQGHPVSAQRVRRRSLRLWQLRIVEASRERLPEGHFASVGPIGVTLYYFPAVAMRGDIDNIVKPILDAMCRHISLDDHQVERLLVQKFEPGSPVAFRSPSPTMLEALSRPRPVLYVRLTNDPLGDLAR